MTPPNQDNHRPLFEDRFDKDAPRGRVDQSRATDATTRLLSDPERVIAIDHAQLRIGTLKHPGFGRASLAYPALDATPGLTLAVAMLNGHNTSQTYELRSPIRQLARWLRGGGAYSPLRQALRYLTHHSRDSILRRYACWHASARSVRPRPTTADHQRENLAIGFFEEPAPTRPWRSGVGIVMRAASHECGEVNATCAGSLAPAFRGFQNLQAQYVVALRDGSAIQYVAATPGASGAAHYPLMRPIGIDPRPLPARLHPGVHQGVLGEIGFSVDSRVSGVRVARLEEFAPWHAGAIVADRLASSSPSAEIGGRWHTSDPMRWVSPAQPIGLVHARIGAGLAPSTALCFRVADAQNYWRVSLEASHATLECVEGGVSSTLARVEFDAASRPTRVQVLDDGARLVINLAPGPTIEHASTLHAEASGVGFIDPVSCFRDFEAHPRTIPIPEALRIEEPWNPTPGPVAFADDFAGGSGDLANAGPRGSPTPRSWQRTFGRGRFDLTGDALRVRASLSERNPGRTIYTIPWDHEGFARLELDMTPPGSGRGEGHDGRSGLILWQDPENYLLLNIWLHDGYEGASVSSFFVYQGFDDVFNAVWTNVGSRILWGRRLRLSITSDGQRYLVHLYGEPVLYRRLSDVYPTWDRLHIRRVGIASNWEWGDDSGTVFHRFVARAQR